MSSLLYLDVLLPLPLSKGTYTYTIAWSGTSEGLEGKLALVPFRQNHTLTGVITRVHSSTPPINGIRYKRVLQLLPYPPLPRSVLQFWHWVAEYYMCTVGEVFVAAVPAIFRPDGEQKFSFASGFVPSEEVAPFAEQYQAFTLKELKQHCPHHYTTLLSQWLEHNSIEPATTAKVYAPDVVKGWKVATAFWDNHSWQEQIREQLKGSSATLATVEQILAQRPDGTVRSLTEWSEVWGGSAHVLNRLKKMGILVKGQMVRPSTTPPSPIIYTPEAQEPLHFQGKNILLLHHQGSHLLQRIEWHTIQEEVAKHQQVLLLFPSLATLQLAQPQLEATFGTTLLYLFYSGTSTTQRHRAWLAALEGKEGVYVGLRASVWLPFRQLSLVHIVDEEDEGYRQFEPAPRFTASCAALILANLCNARTLLTSACPSIESHLLAVQGRYALQKRVAPKRSCTVEAVPLKKAFEKNKVRGRLLSYELIRAIENALYQGKRALLFFQRRGYATQAICPSCGEVPKCPKCHTPYRYFQKSNQLVCSLCGTHQPLPSACPSCQATKLQLTGTGVERLAQSVRQLFRGVEVAELQEGDYTSAPIQISASYSPFLPQLQEVATIGVVQLDLLSTQLNFRANEHAFRFLTACYNEAPHLQHLVVQYLAEGQNSVTSFLQDSYQSMVEHELAERNLVSLPPFSRLIDVYFQSHNRQVAANVATQAAEAIAQRLPTCTVLGLAPLPARKKQMDVGYKFTITTSLELSPTLVRHEIRAVTDHILTNYRGPQLNIYFDVDPQ